MTHGDAKRLAKVAEMFRDVIQHYIRVERGKTFSWEYAEKSLKEADQLWSKDNG
jgi:accessory colonization factor AcfC